MGVCTPNFPPSFLLHRRDRLPIFQQSKASREFSAKSDWQPLQTRHHPGPESQRKDGATWAGSQVQGGPGEPWGGGWGRTPRTTAQARWLPSCALGTPLPGNPPEGVCVAPSLPAAHHVLGTEGPPASNPELSRSCPGGVSGGRSHRMPFTASPSTQLLTPFACQPPTPCQCQPGDSADALGDRHPREPEGRSS